MIAFAKPDNIIAMPQKSNEWFTPSKYIEAARQVLGGIDLDPASCAEANMVVRASRFYTKHDNGLEHPWHGNVWLNPPYGRIHPELTGSTRSWQPLFIQKLVEEYTRGSVKQAILLLLGNALFKQWFPPLQEYLICLHPTSIAFMRPGRKHDDTDRLGFGSIFIYLGKDEQRFIDTFSAFGPVYKRVSQPRQTVTPLSLWEAVQP